MRHFTGDATFGKDPHVLIVHKAGEPYGPLSIHDWEQWEVVHHKDCPKALDHYFWETTIWCYSCWMGEEVSENGLRHSLRYSGTPVDDPGIYLIDTWAEIYKGYEYTEYDSGVSIVEGPIDNDFTGVGHDLLQKYDINGLLPACNADGDLIAVDDSKSRTFLAQQLGIDKS